MKNNRSIIIGVIVVLVVIGIGVALLSMNKSKSPVKSTTAAAVVNNAVLKTKTISSLGAYLTEPNGKPLYTYGSDSANMSNCNGTCIDSWPPYIDSGASTGLPANVGTITRLDSNLKQYTYKGLPLYTFTSDNSTQPTGNGAGGFLVAHP
jgi:predicted lipoprotein with Yx(FWY)xxD motif